MEEAVENTKVARFVLLRHRTESMFQGNRYLQILLDVSVMINMDDNGKEAIVVWLAEAMAPSQTSCGV